MTGRLILLRHGQSAWNISHRFTGWADPPLTKIGRAEASNAGDALRAAGMIPDLAVTSVLSRASESLALVLDALRADARTQQTWRLNERHYGALEGSSHDDARRRYGHQQVQTWRRSWDATPPPLTGADFRHPRHDPRYAGVPRVDLPDSESLVRCLRRQRLVLDGITEAVADGATVLLVGHGNSLRALVACLEQIAPHAIPQLLVPTGVPLVYQRDHKWHRDPIQFPLHGTWTGP